MFDATFGIAFSLVWVWLVCGVAYRISVWLRSRSVFQIPLAPAPGSRAGVLARLFLEVFTFRSLARAERTTWLASLAFHYGLLWVLIIHIRFVYEVLPLALLPFIRFGFWATLALVTGLVVLLLRRIIVDRVRYISAPSDYLHLVLLLSIALSGVVLKRIWPTGLAEVGEFLRGTFTFGWTQLPDHAPLVIHLSLVLILLLVFPISKLVHGVGIVFSPTFNQRDRS